MFEKTMLDLVKGIRSTKLDPSVYISQSIHSIRTELKSTDVYIKSEAIRKLTYLHMLGYDMQWSAFNVVEVMSYDKFSHKRIGYLAACQCFTQDTEVVLLCTNLLKKEFGSGVQYEVGLAINCLANIATCDLARDLLGDVVQMMGSSNSYVRKKATLVLYKLFLRYPQGLRLTFDTLKDKMQDPESAVVSSAVNVICELANKKPKNYVGLAPIFFQLLTTSSNNWMLIKVVKLMKALLSEEPRLARKLIDPLASIIQNTPAKSLLYECISTVAAALLYTKKSDGGQPMNVPAVVRLCNDQLKKYIENEDQNLKYLGLVGLVDLMQSHPYVVTEHQAVILDCLRGDDITIRMRALELISGMITVENCIPIIKELKKHAIDADGYYRDELIKKILLMCSADKYNNVEDFEWYISVLVELAHLSGGTHGTSICTQLIDISVRVETIRKSTVKAMIPLITDESAMNLQGGDTIAQVLYAAVWIVGEYAHFIGELMEESTSGSDENSENEDEDTSVSIVDIVDSMLQPRTATLPARVQTVYMQNLLKLLSVSLKEDEEDESDEAAEIATLMMTRLPAFMQSEHLEVQERAVSLQQILITMGLGLDALPTNTRSALVFDQNEKERPSPRVLFFIGQPTLAPVNPKAQSRVRCPAELELGAPLNAKASKWLVHGNEENRNKEQLRVSFVKEEENEQDTRGFNDEQPSMDMSSRNDDSTSFQNEYTTPSQKIEEKNVPDNTMFYLGNTATVAAPSPFESTSSSRKKKKKKKSSRRKHAVLQDDLMPTDAASSDEEKPKRSSSRWMDKEQALEDIDITAPLSEAERIPDAHLIHYQAPTKKESKKGKKAKKKKDKMEELSKENKKVKSKKKKSSKHNDEENTTEKERGNEMKKKSKKKSKKSSGLKSKKEETIEPPLILL